MGETPSTNAFVDILLHLDTGVLLFDQSGDCCFCTDTAVDLLGCTPSSMSAFIDRVAPLSSVREQVWHLLESASLEQASLIVESAGREHSVSWLKLTAFTVGEMPELRTAVILHDLSQEVGQQRRIEHLNRLAAVGQLAAGVAHEFNNNLTSVLGWTQIAEQNVAADSPALSALEIIGDNARKAKRIFTKLLNMSRDSLGEGESERTVTSLASVVEDVLSLLSFEMKTLHIECTHTFHDVGTCQIDKDAISQVIVNIVRNAMDAMGEGGTLDVSLSRSDDALRLSFDDNGPGMAPDVLDRVFESFFSTKLQEDTSVYGGTGLGLSISLDIIQRHGGEIEVRSVPGSGTCFTVILPALSDAFREEKSERASRPTIPPGAVVLVVDDGPDVGEMIRMSLELKGVSVISVKSGEEALQYLGKMPFDAAFVDYSMPGLSGHDLGRKIMEIRPDLPTIFMSGLTVETDDVVMNFIKKPFDLDEIQTKLYEVLKRRKEEVDS